MATKTLLVASALLAALAAAGASQAVVFQTGQCLVVLDQPLPCQGVYARVLVNGPGQEALVIACVQGAVNLGCTFQPVALPAPLPYSGPYQDCRLYIFEGGPVEGIFFICLPRVV